MSAAAQLAETTPNRTALAPMGIPVRGGRLHLGRLRCLLDADVTVAVVAGFATRAGSARRRDAHRTSAGSPTEAKPASTTGVGSCSTDGSARGWL